MNKLLLSLITLCLLPAGAFSGPDETTNHLMNDSASMLDFGLLRLEINLESKGLGTPTFDWDKNRIIIWKVSAKHESVEAAEEACSQWVRDVRAAAYIDLDTGQAYLDSSLFSGYFGHYGFSRKSAPETLRQEIDKLFELKCSNFVDGGGYITVTATLLGTGYALEK